jgi:Right handed beta helix region
MNKQFSKSSVWLLSTLLSLSITSLATAMTTGTIISLPTCGNTPNDNTKMLQAKINLANPGDTLVLPPGVCVVAKCDLAQGQICYGVDGHPHRSALHIGNKSNLTIVGAANGTSALKLDPNPPGTPGHHAYCGDTHVLSITLSRFITLRNFTVDGSDGELPEDTSQCPPDADGTPNRIDEHLHDVRVLNATDVVIDRMKITKAHGDGINLMAEHTQTAMPFTERVSVTNTDFLANDRSGIAFQRNVGYVTIVGNTFRNSGEDQDLDMEPSGGPTELGPYNVTINHNLFERPSGKIAVSLGSASAQRSHDISFTFNTIQASPLANPPTTEGGCVFVYTADHVTIANNTIIGAQNCVTLEAQKVTDLVIEHNRLEGFANLQERTGKFAPRAVVEVLERVVNQGDTNVCGAPPRQPCPYHIYYPDRTTVKGNTIIQHVRQSLGVRLSNADASTIADNIIEATNAIAPVGTVDLSVRALGIYLPFGNQTLPSYGFYDNERTLFTGWTVSGNQLTEFADGLKMFPVKTGLGVASTSLTTNTFNTSLTDPRGIYLQGAVKAPDVGFIKSLFVNKNAFGCGFYIGPFPTLVFPLHAFVRPSGQPHTGNIGVVIPCQ